MKNKIFISILLISFCVLLLAVPPTPPAPSAMGDFSKVGSDTPLPVELSAFNATYNGDGILLSWSTGSESENLGFNLYKTVNSERVLVASYLDNDALLGQGTVTQTSVYNFIDTEIKAGTSYTYTLADIKLDGTVTLHSNMSVTVTVPENNSIIAEDFTLEPLYPNPFNPSFTIPFTLNKTLAVDFNLYDLTGHHVMQILNAQLSAGSYRQSVTPLDLTSGIYILRSLIGNRLNTQKIVLMK